MPLPPPLRPTAERPPPTSSDLPTTLKDMRTACKLVGLSSNGNKSVLLARLVEHKQRTVHQGPSSVNPLGSSPSGHVVPAANGAPSLVVEGDAGPAAETGTPAGNVPPAIAPRFTKHEFARLFHVMCEPDVASGVVASKGPLTRQQLDSGEARRDVWATVVAPIFNDSLKTFGASIPECCATYEMNPDVHPHNRDGDKLKSKFAEVSREDQEGVCFFRSFV